MQDPNLLQLKIRTRRSNNKPEVFDPVRKRYVMLTPEEKVRQYFIQYLTQERNVPLSLIAAEVPLRYNRLKKRSDIVVYGTNGKPCLIVECKAQEVEMTQAVFDQVAMYNMTLKVPYLVVTNGTEQYACYIDHQSKKYYFLKEVPSFNELMTVPETIPSSGGQERPSKF